MLDRLCGSDKTGVQRGYPAKLLHDFSALIGDAIDPLARLSTSWLAKDAKARSSRLT
jgi:hypothetical protein